MLNEFKCIIDEYRQNLARKDRFDTIDMSVISDKLDVLSRVMNTIATESLWNVSNDDLEACQDIIHLDKSVYENQPIDKATEGILSTVFDNVWTFLKSLVNKLIEFFKWLYNKVIAWFKNVISTTMRQRIQKVMAAYPRISCPSNVEKNLLDCGLRDLHALPYERLNALTTLFNNVFEICRVYYRAAADQITETLSKPCIHYWTSIKSQQCDPKLLFEISNAYAAYKNPITHDGPIGSADASRLRHALDAMNRVDVHDDLKPVCDEFIDIIVPPAKSSCAVVDHHEVITNHIESVEVPVTCWNDLHYETTPSLLYLYDAFQKTADKFNTEIVKSWDDQNRSLNALQAMIDTYSNANLVAISSDPTHTTLVNNVMIAIRESISAMQRALVQRNCFLTCATKLTQSFETYVTILEHFNKLF